MSTYPEDIDKIATAIVRADYTTSGDEPDYLMFKAIADALVAERERCAKVALERFTTENVIKTAKGDPYITGSAAIYAAGQISEAILKGSTE